jgi:dienelactone hydrolase
LVVHEWWGLNAYALRRAEELTAQGWNALAVDMYGEAASSDFPTAVKRSGPFYQNPGLFVQRLELFVAAARARADVDGQRMAAIGFCFGGSAVLQAARANMDLKAVVAFHPGLKTAAPASTMPKARILVCHGGADPFVPPADVAGFISEMTTAQAWWRMEIFGGAVHAFTNPQAGVGVTNVPAEVPFAQAVAHHPEAEAASISAMQAFVRAAF